MSDPNEVVGAYVEEVQRFIPRCFACGWDGPPMMRGEAVWAAAGHNRAKHGVPENEVGRPT